MLPESLFEGMSIDRAPFFEAGSHGSEFNARRDFIRVHHDRFAMLVLAWLF